MTDLIGQQLGQYQVLAPLGEGGMGAVYRAHQPSIGRDVAIKVIAGRFSAQDDFTLRFTREVKLSASLSHAHIIKVFDYGRDSVLNIDYFVMELLTGGSLFSLMRSGPLTLDRTMRLIDEVTSALDYAHQKNVIHRDLKPLNVLLDEAGNAYLSDFGLAKLIADSSGLTRTGMAVGTWGYMSPEQWRGQALDGRVDVYALGIMLFEMLTGRQPFHAETVESMLYQHLFELPPSISSLRPDLPRSLDAVIARSLAKDRDARYQTAGEVANALHDVLLDNWMDKQEYAIKVTTADMPVAGTSPNEKRPDQLPTLLSDSMSASAEDVARNLANVSRSAAPSTGSAVVAGLDSSEVKLLDTQFNLIGHDRPVTLIAFNPDGRLLLSCDMGKTVSIWSSADGRELRRLPDYTPWEVSHLAFSPDGQTTILGGRELIFKPNGDWSSVGAAVWWAFSSERPLWHMPESRHIREVLAVGFSTEGAPRLVSDGASVGIWELHNAVEFAISDTGQNSRNGETAAMPLQLVRVWELIHERPINCAALSIDGHWLVTADGSIIFVWQLESGRNTRQLTGHADRVQSLTVSSDGRLLASLGRNSVRKTGSVRLWNLNAGREAATLRAEASVFNGIRALAFSPDGRLLVGGSEDGSIAIWDTTDGRLYHTLYGHSGEVHSLLFSPDGRRIASGSYDKSIKLWGIP
jgi:serine/threonine protein kinase